MPLKTIDLFSGCGGFSKGLIDAGFDVQLGIDYVDTLSYYNFLHDAVKHDLVDWEKAVEIVRKRVGEVDVVAGSPPCVEFSRAGKQHEGNIANLTVCFAQIVCRLQPSIFIMENVPDVVQSNSFKTASKLFEEFGYSFCVLVRDARYSGVPQNRRRAFVIGCAATEENEKCLSDLVRMNKHREEIVSVAAAAAAQKIECPEFLFFPSRNHHQAQVVSTDEPYQRAFLLEYQLNQNQVRGLRAPASTRHIANAVTLSVVSALASPASITHLAKAQTDWNHA